MHSIGQMSGERFLLRYSGAVAVPFSRLLAAGAYAQPCKCGDANCPGWRVAIDRPHDAVQNIDPPESENSFSDGIV